MTSICLSRVGGVAQLCGVDQHAQLWCEFWADDATSETGTVLCAMCGRPIFNGWICLVNGESRCHEHIEY